MNKANIRLSHFVCMNTVPSTVYSVHYKNHWPVLHANCKPHGFHACVRAIAFIMHSEIAENSIAPLVETEKVEICSTVRPSRLHPQPEACGKVSYKPVFRLGYRG